MMSLLLLHLQDLGAWLLLVGLVASALFGIWLAVDTLVTYSKARIR